MKASQHGRAGFGAGKFWFHPGVQPETYSYGPFEDREEAEDEARQFLEDSDHTTATIGRSEEVEVVVPDADDVIEKITDDLYEQCGEAGTDYLDHHSVTQAMRNDLNEAIEKAVADWLTRHDLWPTFCGIEEVGTVTHDPAPSPGAGENRPPV